MKHRKNKKIAKYASLTLALALAAPFPALAAEQVLDEEDKIIETYKAENIPAKDANDTNDTNETASTKLSPAEEVTPAVPAYNPSISGVMTAEGKLSYEINLGKAEGLEANPKAYIYLYENSGLANPAVSAASNSADKNGVKVISVDLKDQASFTFTADAIEGKKGPFFDILLVDENNDFVKAKRIINTIGDGKQYTIATSNDITFVPNLRFIDDTTIEYTDYILNPNDAEALINQDFNLSEGLDITGQKITITPIIPTAEGFKETEATTLDMGNLKDLKIPANGLVKLRFTTKAAEDVASFTINGVEVKRASNKAINDSAKVEELIDNLEENNEKIDDAIIEIDGGAELPEVEEGAPVKDGGLSSEKADDKKPAADQPKAELPKELPTVQTLNDTAKETSFTLPSGANFDEILAKITANNELIAEEIIKLDEEVVARDGGLRLTAAKQNSLAETPATVSLGDPDVEKLIADLEEGNRQLDKHLELVIDEIIGTTVAANHQEPLKAEVGKILSNVNRTNDDIAEVIRQINLSVELEELDKNPADKEKVAALAQTLQKQQEEAKKALETVENTKANTNANGVSKNFRIIEKDFSTKLYKDLEKVATVTLDPLPEIDTEKTSEELRKKNPTVVHYLEDLNLRSDLLANKK